MRKRRPLARIQTAEEEATCRKQRHEGHVAHDPGNESNVRGSVAGKKPHVENKGTRVIAHDPDNESNAWGNVARVTAQYAHRGLENVLMFPC